jgi:hypothetical protein
MEEGSLSEKRGAGRIHGLIAATPVTETSNIFGDRGYDTLGKG